MRRGTRGDPGFGLKVASFDPRAEKLIVGRRDCTKLVDGVRKQVGRVGEVVGDSPVTGVLCFVAADWPLIGGAFTIYGVEVLWPTRLAQRLAEAGGSVDVATVRERLAARFPAA